MSKEKMDMFNESAKKGNSLRSLDQWMMDSDEEEFEYKASCIFKNIGLIVKRNSEHTMGKTLTLIETIGLHKSQELALVGLIKTFFKEMRQDILSDNYDGFKEHVVREDDVLTRDLWTLELHADEWPIPYV